LHEPQSEGLVFTVFLIILKSCIYVEEYPIGLLGYMQYKHGSLNVAEMSHELLMRGLVFISSAGPNMHEIAVFARVKCAEQTVFIEPFNVPRARKLGLAFVIPLWIFGV
jgi:hypothetical protein